MGKREKDTLISQIERYINLIINDLEKFEKDYANDLAKIEYLIGNDDVRNNLNLETLPHHRETMFLNHSTIHLDL